MGQLDPRHNGEGVLEAEGWPSRVYGTMVAREGRATGSANIAWSGEVLEVALDRCVGGTGSGSGAQGEWGGRRRAARGFFWLALVIRDRVRWSKTRKKDGEVRDGAARLEPGGGEAHGR